MKGPSLTKFASGKAVVIGLTTGSLLLVGCSKQQDAPKPASGNVIGLVGERLADIATLKITGSLPQNVNYALKSSFITAFLETVPEVSAKLKSSRPAKARPLTDIATEAKQSVALVTVY